MRSIRISHLIAAMGLLGCLAAPSPLPAQTKKILFVAGPKDHGAPGRHEYEKDLRTLAYALEHSSNLKGVTTEVIVGQIPRDLSKLKDVALIVVESSSDRVAEETHAIFANTKNAQGYRDFTPEEMAFAKGLDGLIQKGMGLIVYHYATWIDNPAGAEMLTSWLGGGRKSGFSTNPVDDWSMAPAPGAEKHPILRGVKPWTYREELFCKFVISPDGTTPLLIGTPTRSTVGQQVASWAYERKGGGRSLVMGGLDWHSGMQIEDNRKFLLNGIVWAAGMQVPEGGVQSTIPADM